MDTQLLEVELGPNESMMATMDEKGDTPVRWNRSLPTEVEIARAAFDSARKRGYAAYKMSEAGAKGEVIHTFDPAAERIILAPPMVGG